MSSLPLFALIIATYVCHAQFPWYWWLYAWLVSMFDVQSLAVKLKKEDE